MIDEVILKKQVTSYFLEKNLAAMTKVITDVWRKGWARSLAALGLGLRDALASLDKGEFLIDAVRTQCQLPNIRMAEWSIPGCDPTTTYEPLLPAERLRGGDPDLLPGWNKCMMEDQVVAVRALVQLLQAVMASSFCRTISGRTKVLVRLAMTLHTWSRIVMRCTSSSRHLRSLQYLD